MLKVATRRVPAAAGALAAVDDGAAGEDGDPEPHASAAAARNDATYLGMARQACEGRARPGLSGVPGAWCLGWVLEV